jgi:uncharacterized protein (TIGR01777 family)
MPQPKRILITGASGLVGSRLTELLQQHGHEVWHLSRSNEGTVKTFQWDVHKQTIHPGALEGVNTIVHLAGAGVADKRWTNKRKKEIIDSRVQSIKLLFSELEKGNHEVKDFVSASAIGYYGFDHPEKIFREADPPGTDFLAQVTKQWEAEADTLTSLGLRVVKMRLGVVLAKNGGALKPIASTVKRYVGAPLGSGNQFISWIHLDDVCGMFIKAIADGKINGPVNAVAPEPVTNKQLTKMIASKLHKPMVLPAVPAFVLRLALGEMADIVLEGAKVSPEKILQIGYEYKFRTLEEALTDLL